MATKVLPKTLQGFRAREFQRLIIAGGAPQGFPAPYTTEYYAKLKSLRINEVNTEIDIQNPFLPHAKKFKTEGEKAGRGLGKWSTPRYSLRRQAELVKAAREAGVLHLLPPGPKCTVEEIKKAAEEAAMKAGVTQQKQVSEKKEVATESKAGKASPSERRKAKKKSPLFRVSKVSGLPDVVFRWTGKAPESRHRALTIYEGRRRMFKGHKWERHLEKRRAQIAVRMRDMSERIQRFKNVSYTS